MTTSSELELLMERSKANGAEDAAFFKALLDATIYVHVPKDKHKFPWRFMQFQRSDEPGMLIPFFRKVDSDPCFPCFRLAPVRADLGQTDHFADQRPTRQPRSKHEGNRPSRILPRFPRAFQG